MSFDAIGLSSELLKSVKACGYKNMTPIQQRAIPAIRKGSDILATAQTGTGKSAAFSLPIIEALAKTNQTTGKKTIRALVLSPTRELAEQLGKNIETYCQFMPLETGVIYGGVKMPQQTKMLKQGIDILVATPGRLIEHLNDRTLNLSHVKFFVLDEADRMLDMGFLTDIETLMLTMKQKRQTIMFSATFSNRVKTLARTLLNNPVTIDISAQNSTADNVKQSVYSVTETRKRELLSEIIGVNNWKQVLVFAGTKESANILAKELKLDGLKAALCHGDKSQGARRKAIEDFTTGKIRVLVATDVAARGLDIADLPYVVNFHLPFLAEDYVHRIGRTGRAGKTGRAISLVSPKDEKFLTNIEELLGGTFERIVMPGYELDLPMPSQYKENLDEPVKKSRYKANKERNDKINERKEDESGQSRFPKSGGAGKSGAKVKVKVKRSIKVKKAKKAKKGGKK
jgi:ATP-dependent RNA helicase RhlE